MISLQDFNLATVVQTEGQCLIARYGGELLPISDSHVRVVTDRVTLQFSYGQRYSHELEVSAFQNGFEDEVVRLGSKIRDKLTQTGDGFQIPECVRPDHLSSVVTEFVGVLMAGYDDLMQGDEEVFQQLVDEQKRAADEYTESLALKAVRESARAAWANNNYAMFAQLLSPFRSILTPSDAKKLEYAERHS